MPCRPPKAAHHRRDSLLRRLAFLACLLYPWWGGTLTAAEPMSFPGAGPVAAVRLTGTFYQAAGAKPPAVVLLHTCGGLSPHEYAWADWFVSKGYSALVVDSFGPRGVTNICNRPGAPTPHDRGFDALGALAWLRSRPDVDASRIAVIGWSHGGGAAIAADMALVVRNAALSGGGFRAAIALYPVCREPYGAAFAAPLLLLMGEADEWTPPARCMDRIKDEPPGGPTITTVIYPGATHEFDNHRAHGTVRVGNHDVPLSYNAQVDEDAHARVRAFLTAQMR